MEPEAGKMMETFTMRGQDSSTATYNMLVAVLIANPRSGIAEFGALANARGVGRHRARKFLSSGVHSGRICLQAGARRAKFHTWIGTVE